MSKHRKYSVLVFIFLLFAGCDDPDLLLVNTVHKDGSVTRKVIMTWNKPDFDLTDAQVPVDSTWTIHEEMSISEEFDTLYTLVAEKTFQSVNEINADYLSYAGSNKALTRHAVFSKKFRWFTNQYSYSENINKALDGYDPADYFTEDELNVFYMPEEILKSKLAGPDSLIYSAIQDSLEQNYENWLGKSVVRAMILKISELNKDSTHAELQQEFLFDKEEELADAIFEGDWDEYEIVDYVLGEGYSTRHKFAIDTAMSSLEQDFTVAFDTDDYLLQTIMPGDLLETNGYIDTDGNINWKVNGDVILSKDYSMWAMSTTTNWWAWVVSVVFLLFVLGGFINRLRK